MGNRKNKDISVIQVGEFLILSDEIEKGYLHIINPNTNWQIKMFLGLNAIKITLIDKEKLYNRINSIYIQSMMSIYDDEYAANIAESSLEYWKEKSDSVSTSTDKDNLDEKGKYMMDILSKSEEEIMMDIASGEFKFDMFKEKEEEK